MNGSSIQDRYIAMLLERVRQDNFPSGEYMNRIEASLSTPEQLEAYIEVLFEKVEDLRFPSLSMLDRIQRLGAMLGPRQ
jgi:hypothetical protein